MNKDQSVNILLEIYKAIREESKAALQFQQNILNWSSVAVGVLLIFALNLWKTSALLAFGFFILVFPSASFMFLNLWLMEVARMMRAGRYLVLVEGKLHDFLLDEKFPLFEQWLREKNIEGENRFFTFGYKSGVAIYLGIIVFSHLVANIIFWTFSDDSLILNDQIYKAIFSFSTAMLDGGLILSARKRVKKYIL